jgi:hypothetical protein
MLFGDRQMVGDIDEAVVRRRYHSTASACFTAERLDVES